MESLFFATDGTASAFASVQQYALGFVGLVRFSVDPQSSSAIRHGCIRYRDSRAEALEDARIDARKLVQMWVEDRVHLRDA